MQIGRLSATEFTWFFLKKNLNTFFLKRNYFFLSIMDLNFVYLVRPRETNGPFWVDGKLWKCKIYMGFSLLLSEFNHSWVCVHV